MNWDWNLWRRKAGRSASAEERVESAKAKADLWMARLVEEGVAEDLARALADRLAPVSRELGPGAAIPLIRGALIAVDAQAEAQANVERNMRDVKEVERLLGAFSGELEKLDEVLEVMSAYAQRMRSNQTSAPRRTLH